MEHPIGAVCRPAAQRPGENFAMLALQMREANCPLRAAQLTPPEPAPLQFRQAATPRIRPGVVVHDPTVSVEALLENFATTLKERGFNVTGFIQHREVSVFGSGCIGKISYLDLQSGLRVDADRKAALHLLQRATQDNADLLIISRFSACVDATESLHLQPASDGQPGLPILTSIAGHCIHKWHSYIRQDGTMLSPAPVSLWDWWGPEHLYGDLALGVADGPVRRVVWGTRWIMVEGEDGVGLAPLPRRPNDLCLRLRNPEKRSLRELAALSTSWDPLETALGIAAVNAHYNRRGLSGLPGNGIRTFRHIANQTVVVGAFPGVSQILPGCRIIEADPRPGEYPTPALESLFHDCYGAIVNASALIQRTLPRLLCLAQRRPLALIGPATPLTPRLHAYGVNLLGGFIVTDADGLAAALRAGASARQFTGSFGRHVSIGHFPSADHPSS